MSRLAAVTGATGFIGSHVVRRLAAEGWRVRILTRRLPVHANFAEQEVEAVIGTLDEPEALRELAAGADAIVHCAGLVKARTRRAFFRTNAEAVAALAAAAGGGGGRPRFLLLSSLAAREPQLSAYAASKRAGEAALAEREAGLPWTVLRPPAVYGPGDRETLAFFRYLAKGFAPILGGPRSRVSLVHAEDLADAIALLLDRGAPGRIYEVDDGKPGGYRWREIAEAAAALLEVRPRYLAVPPPLLHALAMGYGVAGLLSGRAQMLTPGKARELLHPDWVSRDRAIAEELGWRPRWGIAEGFAQALAWYRRQGWL